MAKLFQKILEAAAGEDMVSKSEILQQNHIGSFVRIYDIETARMAFGVRDYDPYTYVGHKPGPCDLKNDRYNPRS